MPGSRRARLLLAAYALSGTAALLLEVAWTRLLGLHLGHTTGATSTVLAAVMGGLAAGSLIAGAAAPRLTPAAALRAFALAEAVIAAAALAVPRALHLLAPLLAHTYADGAGGLTFGTTRTVVCLATLGVPALAMGAGYPLLLRALTPASSSGSPAGALYVTNTLGAAVGAVLAGFVLLPALGTRDTTWIAAALDGIVAIVAWTLASRDRAGSLPGGNPPRRAAAGRSISPPALGADPGLGVVVAALLGAVSLSGQVAWTRVLALIVGPTTFAFSALLGVVIGGMAVGASLGTWLGRRRRPAALLGTVALAVAASTLAAIAMADRLALWMARDAATTASFAAMVVRQLAVAVVLVGPVSVCLGAAFPLALAVVGPGVRGVAGTFAANTCGGIAGALLAGFALVPSLGLQATLHLGAALAIGAGALALVRARPRRGDAVPVALVAAVAAGAAWHGGWNPTMLASGPYRFAPAGATEDLELALTTGEVLYLREGAAATVAVRRLAGTTSLVIDGKPDASDAGDMLTQKLLGHLPLLLHAQPRRVAVIGLGSGVTVGAALRHPAEAVDVIEISPDVVQASRHFEAVHGRALDDPRVRVVVTDARSHLRFTRATYDVVVSEPSNPWMAGVAALFTREFLEDVRARLAPGGIVCQWAHTYDMAEADLRSIVATFQAVFPDGGAWLVGEADLLLVGGRDVSPEPALLVAGLQRPGVLDDLRSVGVTGPTDLLGLRVADGAGLRTLAGAGVVQRDDRLALEFSAPRSLASRTGRDNVAWLRAGAPPPATTLAAWRSRADMLFRAEAWSLAYEAYARVLEGGDGDEVMLEAFTRAAAGAGRLADAEGLLRRALAEPAADAARRATLSRILVARGDVRAALELLRPTPSSPAVILRAAAGIFADVGDTDTLSAIVGDLTRQAPDHADTLYYEATVAFQRDDLASAERLARRGIARVPADARLRNLLGAALATAGRHDEAEAAFGDARRLDPREPGTYVNSGRLAQARGRPSEAAQWYAQALALDPSSEAARHGLAAVRPAS